MKRMLREDKLKELALKRMSIGNEEGSRQEDVGDVKKKRKTNR